MMKLKNHIIKSLVIIAIMSIGAICLAESEEEELLLTPSKYAKIIHHSLSLNIDPPAHSLVARDNFKVLSKKDDLKILKFLISDLDIDRIKGGDKELNFTLDDLGGDVKKLTIELDSSLSKEEEIELEMSYHQDDYILFLEKTPVPGYNIFGQIREDSAYSSHITYYPVDEMNDATGDIRITVPAGYVAVSAGKLVGIVEDEERGLTTYHWITGISIPRSLPFGFAIAKYERFRAVTPSGTPIDIYAYPGEASIAKQRLKVAEDVVTFYEDIFGPFAFEKLAIAHVLPEKGIAGVSLPTLILLSTEYFTGDISYDFEDMSILEASQGPLVIADEISHQWNFYSVAFPNVLAEGMAQYTDTLFAEYIAGKEILKKYTNSYSQIYKADIAHQKDAPISSPEVYNTPAYGEIVFAKGAMVINMLRYVLGDEEFFAGTKDIFSTYQGKQADFDDFRVIMEKHYKEGDLKWFFEEWYNRSGYPHYEVSFHQTSQEEGSYKVSIDIVQIQEGKVFKMPIDISVEHELGIVRYPKIMIDEREETLEFEIPYKVISVKIDEDEWLLKDVDYKHALSSGGGGKYLLSL